MIEDGRVIAERAGDAARSHAERLPGDLLRVLEENGVSSASIDLFAVAAGPGSFTGLRIGLATMQGFAFVHRRPIVAVLTLEALAQVGSCELPPGALVAAWMDAHRREVFSALYLVTDAPVFSVERLEEMDRPVAGDPARILERWAASFPAPAVFVGDGAEMYTELLTEGARVQAAPLLAGAIGLLAISRAKRGESVPPAGVQPMYVRRPDVEVKREKSADG